MVETEINNYINKKCYDCCHFKKENMELYKLNLPNGIVSNIIDYALGKEDECRTCRRWRRYQNIIENMLEIKKIDERNVEDAILIFLTVYKIPPYSYVRIFLKISKKTYEMIKGILWMLTCHFREGFDVKEDIKTYIEGKKFKVKNTVRDINIIFKMMHERDKIYTQFNGHQLNYYPALKL